MYVYRIAKKECILELGGVGAGMFGGHWNPKGLNMVYTAGSIALASLEYMVHNYHLLHTTTVCLAKIKIRDTAPMFSYKFQDLPSGWNKQVSQQLATQAMGKEFLLKKEHYLLKVPSAVATQEYNVLLNPFHPLHKYTKVVEVIEPFAFDSRLLNLYEMS